jgi:hypothetical protein
MLHLSMRKICSDNQVQLSSLNAKHKNLPVSGSHFERGEMCRAWSDPPAASAAPQRNRSRCRQLALVGKKERIMRYVLALLAVVSAWGIMPANSEECEPGVTLASLDDTYTVGSAQHRAEPGRNTAVVKEGEFESLETIAAIERNREDRERTVVMDR